MDVEEEGQARREFIDALAGAERGLDVGNAVGERERDFLDRRRACLADVVARDRDRVPVRHVLGAEAEDVGDDAHRWSRRVDVGAAGDVFLEHIVLGRAVDILPGHTLLLRDRQVEREQDRRGRVDRHRGGDLVEGDAAQQRLHVVERVDGDADAADLSRGARVVGVETHLRRQVERDRETGRSVREQVTIAAVRFLGGAKARVLPHRPEAAAVHRRLHATRERWIAGET